MAATPSVKIVKASPFKGGTRLWSNRYHFNGGVPSGDTQWHALMDAVTAAEKLATNVDTQIVSAVGYDAGSDVPVSSKAYSLTGTSIAAGAKSPLEVAALVRYATTARTSKNHPVYLFNYYHGPLVNKDSAGADVLSSDLRTLLNTYAAAWISGFSDGSHTLVRAGPNGATATGEFTEEYVTHRDFPYSRSA